MTVTTTVLRASLPRPARSVANIDSSSSPVASAPVWSTASSRSASPSRARPELRAAGDDLGRQGLGVGGAAAVVDVRAVGLVRRWRARPRPRRARTSGATVDAAPLAQSTTTRMPVEVASLEHVRPDGRRSRRARVGLVRQPPDTVADGRRRRRPPRGSSTRPSSSSMAASVASGSLSAPGREELDAVVGEGVVRCRDHRGRTAPLRRRARPPRAWGGRRGRPRRRPRSPCPADKRRLEQGARTPGVATDQEALGVAGPGPRPARAP